MSVSDKGKFIVIEGIDGSGKTTQFNLLIKRLKNEGYKITTVDFPRYGTPGAFFIEKYLRGEYGSAEVVGPYRASVFYALDRWDAAVDIKRSLASGNLVLSNRYTESNIGHQGGKISDKKEREEFFKWLYEFEYKMMGIPRPDLVVLLDIPIEAAYDFLDKKGERAYLKGKKRDLHEDDLKHLIHAKESYLQAAEIFKKNWRVVKESDGKKILSPQEISNLVWQEIFKIL